MISFTVTVSLPPACDLNFLLRFAANQILLADTLDLTADNLTNRTPLGLLS